LLFEREQKEGEEEGVRNMTLLLKRNGEEKRENKISKIGHHHIHCRKSLSLLSHSHLPANTCG